MNPELPKEKPPLFSRKNLKRLAHNTPIIKNILFHKYFFAEKPVNLPSLKYFKAGEFPKSGPIPWLDQPNAELLIDQKLKQREISEEDAEACRKWNRDGYFIIKKAFEDSYLDKIWTAYEKACSDGLIELPDEKASDADPYPGRFLNPHFKIEELKEFLHHSLQAKYVELFLGRPCVQFQTITSSKGSQQKEHSDSIHMTTYPLGYLVASWTAMENIHPDSGPLVYYPGSHRLPYVFSRDLGILDESFDLNGYQDYHSKYEPKIQSLIKENNFKPHYFIAEKGDILFWHANLIHGGSLRKDLNQPRKAIVCHHFAKGAVCYHDLAGMQANGTVLNNTSYH